MRIVDTKATGQNIRTIVKGCGIKPAQLTDKMGLASPKAFYKWVGGKNMPTVDNLVTLASITKRSLDEIVITKEVI